MQLGEEVVYRVREDVESGGGAEQEGAPVPVVVLYAIISQRNVCRQGLRKVE